MHSSGLLCGRAGGVLLDRREGVAEEFPLLIGIQQRLAAPVLGEPVRGGRRGGGGVDRTQLRADRVPGTLDAELVADRITTLRTRTAQLQRRADDLTDQLREPTPPPAATLDAVADHIANIIASGTHNQRKAFVEALIDHVKITAPGQLVPVSRIPPPAQDRTPGHAEGPATPQVTSPSQPVRATTNSVELRGLEPLTPTLPVWCATSCATAPWYSPDATC